MKKPAILVCLLLAACVPSGSPVEPLVAEGITAAPMSQALTATPTAQAPTSTPTVTPFVTLVPTNTLAPTPGVDFGTREYPIPRGQSCLVPGGWQITILEVNPDAWPVVQAASSSNLPPEPGNGMVMIRLGTTNVSASGLGLLNAISFYLSGSSNQLYDTYSDVSDCGMIPDKLAEEYFQGSSGEGNVCFEIPLDETELLLLYQHAEDGYIFFAVE